MLNKKTVLFFTGSYNTVVAENVKREMKSDPTTIEVIITKKELTNHIKNALVDKFSPEETRIRQFLRSKREAVESIGSHRTPSQKVNFSRRNALQRRILNALNRYNPQVIVVTTQALLAECLAAVDKYGKDVKVVVVGEEFTLDKRLIHRNVDYYFVDNFDMRAALTDGGIAEEKVEIVSLPVGKEYFNVTPRAEAIKKLALDGRKPTVLVSASKMGDSKFIKVAEAIKNANFDANIVVACGKNRQFINAVRGMNFTAYNEGIDMNTALDACDVLVTRPTTMLLGEAIVKEKKIFALMPNGKTESANLDYLSLDRVTKVTETEELIALMRQELNRLATKFSSPDPYSFTDGLDASEMDYINISEEIYNEGKINKIKTYDENSAKIIAAKILELATNAQKIEQPLE